MKLGKASYANGTKKTFFKMKDGDNVYRILPPMGDLADKGIWSVFYNVHYGYKNSDGKLRPFQSPLVKNYKTKMIEVPDAALERIEKLKAQLDLAKKSGNAALVQKLNELVGQKGSFNLDNNHYVNAIDSQGNIGILKLRHRAMVALKATIEKLRSKNVDPLSVDNGRFFVINRSGTGLDTTFQVSIATRTINVQGVGEVQQDLIHSLDDSLIARLEAEAGKLDKLFKKPTAEEVAQLVAEGATAVDRILDGKGQPTPAGSEGEDYDDSGDHDDTETKAAPATASAPAAPVSAPVTMNSGAVAPPVQQAATTPPAAPAAPVTTATQVDQMSHDEFMKSIGL